jgi:2-hydroxycyclohexanecarboxyl-CoA dehydrogenase
MSEPVQRKPLPLDQCSVLIAGGTSGVGLETAMQFAEAGEPRGAACWRACRR